MGDKSFSIPAASSIDLGMLSSELAELCMAKGYTASVNTPQQVLVTKSASFGMGLGAMVSFSTVNDNLLVSINDQESTTRLIWTIAGFLLCGIGCIPGIIGFVNHSSLLSSLEQDIRLIASKKN